MRLDDHYLRIVYHDAMIKQYAATLQKEGFIVELEKVIVCNNSWFQADLYATKSNEKRIYEFKLVGKSTAQKKNLLKFKEFAKQIGATPFVVYVNPPVEKNIEIDDLGGAIFSYIESDGIPSVLDALSTHTGIDDIEIDNVTDVLISSESISAKGTATIYVNLQYGSNSDDGIETTANFPMTFSAELDSELSVIDLDYCIDTADWYDDELL